MVMLEAPLVGVQEPRAWSVPDAVRSRGREAVEIAASAGLILDEWQAFVLDGALGVREDGKWASFEVGVCVSRQNGKGGILEARELAGLFVFGERLIIHSAHQFDTSLEAFLRMEALIEEAGLQSELRPRSGVSRSHGSEGFALKDGRRLRYRTRTKGGGRGFSCDCLMLDEAMILAAMAQGALLPTLSAKENPQVWYMGSSVDQLVHEDGVVFARVRERGLAGKDPSLAYFDWSAAEADVTPASVDADLLDDPDAWAEANPGLGIRISAEHVEYERRSMDSRTFAVERLGIGDWPATDAAGGVIKAEDWDALRDALSQALDPVCFAFDVPRDRSWASVGVAGVRSDGRVHVEVVERRRGTGWVVDRLVELGERHSAVAFVCDAAGPAGPLVHDLEERLGVEVVTVTAAEHAKACGLLVDAVAQDALRHLGQAELTSAVRGAATRPLGDAWAWSRKNSAIDISPLVACTLALWGASTIAPEKKKTPMFAFA